MDIYSKFTELFYISEARKDDKTGYVYSEIAFWNIKIQTTSQGKMSFIKLIYMEEKKNLIDTLFIYFDWHFKMSLLVT